MYKFVKAKKITHSPRLNTLIMVEDTLKKSNNTILTVADIKRELPKKVNHVTLMAILGYLEESNKIAVSIKGITWIHNTNPKLKDAVNRGLEV